MVATEDWAACANFSWLPAAFCTRTLVSSTSTLAVFRMPSLGDGPAQSALLRPAQPLWPSTTQGPGPASPVVGEGLGALAVECAGSGEHDGGVQVGDDAGHGAGGCDAGLGATIPSLERSQDVGDLREASPVVTGVGAR